MEYNLQNKQVTEKIVKIINDLRDCYIREYRSPVTDWDHIQSQMYMLNCDGEIQSLLEKHDIDIHDNTYFIGITFGILVIKYEVMNSYFIDYGKNMPHYIKEEMYERVYGDIFKYIVNGINNDY